MLGIDFNVAVTTDASLAGKQPHSASGRRGTGQGLPRLAMTLSAGSVTLLSLNPLEIFIVHSPDCGRVNEVVYSPRFAVGLTPAFAISPLVVVALDFRLQSGQQGNSMLANGECQVQRLACDRVVRKLIQGDDRPASREGDGGESEQQSKSEAN